MSDLERVKEIKGKFNQHSGFGVFPMDPKDLYFLITVIEKLLESKSEGTT